MQDIRINEVLIGTEHEPFVIAEMSGNHNQSLEKALKIIDAAADSGAHAVKLQTYTADTLTINVDHGEFFISDPKSLWKGRSLYDLYQEAHTPWDWHKALFEQKKGEFFASVHHSMKQPWIFWNHLICLFIKSHLLKTIIYHY